MEATELADQTEHERVIRFRDPISGLYALIAVHSTVLGPSAGGCRAWPYTSEENAIRDVLRLSQGMTFKNALAGLPFGGGKAVIMLDSQQVLSNELLGTFGDCVDSLAGQYITAEDVGVSVRDMKIVRKRTRFVSGLSRSADGAGGDPSPWTALGVFESIKVSVDFRLGLDNLHGVTVAVQGLGNVGSRLCQLLNESGARLLVSDVNDDRVISVCKRFGATAVDPKDILTSEADVIAPCALGGVINNRTIPSLRAKVIAGAANNQLESESDGDELLARNILYAPDYVINAGGIISVAREYLGGATADSVKNEISRIPTRLSVILKASSTSNLSTGRVAEDMARSIVRTNYDRNHDLTLQGRG